MEAAAATETPITLQKAGDARLLLTDLGVLLLLLDERRHRIIARLFGVSRDQSWLVTLLALVLLAEATQEKSDRMMKGPGGPTRADTILGAATLRELLAGIPGPQTRETPLVATLVTIALVGALVRRGLSRATHEIRSSSHRARRSFNHRYGHFLPTTARLDQHSGATRG